MVSPGGWSRDIVTRSILPRDFAPSSRAMARAKSCQSRAKLFARWRFSCSRMDLGRRAILPVINATLIIYRYTERVYALTSGDFFEIFFQWTGLWRLDPDLGGV
jgi:hypothetical protein